MHAWRVPTSMERRYNRRRRHERTRQGLIEAALNQSAAGSFKDPTVEGVTREAGSPARRSTSTATRKSCCWGRWRI